MRTEKIISKELKEITRTETIFTCDICGEKIPREKTCNTCKRHICGKCSVADTRDWCDDYPRIHCKECWEIGKEYRDRIINEQAECDNKIEQFEKDWLHEALVNLKQKQKV